MSPHLDEGRIVTLRDERSPEAWDTAHLDACMVCTAELDDARTRAAVVAEALSALDAPVDIDSAKASVRRRLDVGRAPERRVRRSIPVGRAAAILLVTAGAAAALPWSPLSPWRPETSGPPAPPTTPTAQPAAQEEAAAEAASISVDVADGIEIVVRGAAPGTVLDVAWQDEASARIVAPRGSSFALAAGRLEVEAGTGGIRIEAPRGARLSLSVNGLTFLERSPDGLSVAEPAAEVTEAGVRFLVRER
ncbi:MAG: hypothetical protein AB7T31_00640 [Gemmatimonadales bacterium]